MTKNFLNPINQDPLIKREQYAVSLRKQKKQKTLTEKRKKIQESLSKVKASMVNIDQSLVEENCFVPYQGYRPWVFSDYKEQKEIISQFTLDDKSLLSILNVLKTK